MEREGLRKVEKAKKVKKTKKVSKVKKTKKKNKTKKTKKTKKTDEVDTLEQDNFIEKIKTQNKSSEQDSISEEAEIQKKLYKYYSKYSKYKKQDYSWPMKNFEGRHSELVNCCSYSPDGNYLATGSFDKTVKVWNIKEKREEFTLNGHSDWIYCCSYSPDGNNLATGSLDKTVRIWNIKERREEFTLNGHSELVKCCSYSPDGNYLATGSKDKRVKIWNIKVQREEFTINEYSSYILCCSYSPDGNYLANGLKDKTVKIWNIKEQRQEFTINGHSDWVYCCSYTPDGNFLATGSKTVKIWNIKERREEFTLNGHSDWVYSCSYSPDGYYLATASDDKTVRIWNIKEKRGEFTFNEHSVNCCSYSPDGNYLATGSNTVKIWNIKEKREDFTFNGHSDWAYCCSYSPDGDYLATRLADKTVKLWNIKEQKEEINFNSKENIGDKIYDWIQLHQHHEPLITNIPIYSEYGLFTIICGDNGIIRVLNRLDGKECFILCYDTSNVKSLFFMENEQYLISIYEKNIYKIGFWNKLFYIIHDNLPGCIIQRNDIKLLFKDAKVAKFIYDYCNEYYQSVVIIEEKLPIIVSEFLVEYYRQKDIQMAMNFCKYLVKFAKLNYKMCNLKDCANAILTKYFLETKNKRFDISGDYDVQILMFIYDSLGEFAISWIYFEAKKKISILLDQLIKIRDFQKKKNQCYNNKNILEIEKFISIEELSEMKLNNTVNNEHFSIELFTSIYSSNKVLVKKYIFNENTNKELRKKIELEFIKEAKCFELLNKYRNHDNCLCEYFGSIKSKLSFSLIVKDSGVILLDFLNEIETLRKAGKEILSSVQLATIIKTLIKSFALLVEKNILHRCINPLSFLIDDNFNIEIIDFIHAAIKINNIWTESDDLLIPMLVDDYRSPEENIKNINQDIDLEKCDVYSLGLVILQLVHSKKIDFIKRKLYLLINNLERRNLVWLQKILRNMLCIQPENRLNFTQLYIFIEQELNETISNSIVDCLVK